MLKDNDEHYKNQYTLPILRAVTYVRPNNDSFLQNTLNIDNARCNQLLFGVVSLASSVTTLTLVKGPLTGIHIGLEILTKLGIGALGISSAVIFTPKICDWLSPSEQTIITYVPTTHQEMTSLGYVIKASKDDFMLMKHQSVDDSLRQELTCTGKDFTDNDAVCLGHH